MEVFLKLLWPSQNIWTFTSKAMLSISHNFSLIPGFIRRFVLVNLNHAMIWSYFLSFLLSFLICSLNLVSELWCLATLSRDKNLSFIAHSSTYPRRNWDFLYCISLDFLGFGLFLLTAKIYSSNSDDSNWFAQPWWWAITLIRDR